MSQKPHLILIKCFFSAPKIRQAAAQQLAKLCVSVNTAFDALTLVVGHVTYSWYRACSFPEFFDGDLGILAISGEP